MNCPTCNIQNPDHARFCLDCGMNLEARPSLICSGCGIGLPLQARFCFVCGAPVDATPVGQGDIPSTGSGRSLSRLSDDRLQRLMPRQYVEQLLGAQGRIAGERRVVTILFSDVKGSTAMAENLDPEEVMAIMDGAFNVLIEPITRYEGTLARLMGDAILAFFGAPIAHEDDPARAGRAALDIVAGARQYAERLERERGITGFNVRVGINTGLVVVGEVGADLRVEYTAMGDAVNLASRMESAAEPGTILITGNTHKLIHSLFETEALGPIQVKGKAEPVPVFRLLGLKAAPGSVRGFEGLRSPLIGRDAELQKLQAAFRNLWAGQGSVTAIVGEAGLGKSRLIEEAHQSSEADIALVEGRALSYDQGMSYWTARDVLYDLLGMSADAPPAWVGAALRSSLEQLFSERNRVPEPANPQSFGSAQDRPAIRNPSAEFTLSAVEVLRTGPQSDLYPYLARLLDVPLEDALEERLKRLAAETLQRRILHAFCDYVRARSLAQPLALVWEDLHWVDPSSLSLLRALLPLADEAPLLLLLVFRPDDGQLWDFHQRTLENYGERYQVVELAPLTHDDSTRLVQGLISSESLPAGMRKLILEKAEGNPFFLEEVLRSLLDAGLVSSHGEALAGQVLEEIHVPDTLQGVIMARIDSLSPQDKRTLQTASVIGRGFQKNVLAHVLGPEMASNRIEESLGELQRREFIRPEKTSEVSEDFGSLSQEYIFQHAMTLEVTYNSLLIAQRRELHRRAGEAIEKLFPDRLASRELAATLAHHFEKAGVHDKALNYLLQAAEHAAHIYANQEAIAYYRRALTLADEAGAQSTTMLPVHMGLGDVYYRVGEYQPAMKHYEQALQHVEEPHQRAALHRKRGQVCEKWGRYDQARECFEAGLAEMRGLLDAAEAARIYTGLGLVYYHQGELDAAIELGALALDLMEGLEDERGIALACNNLGIVYGERGDWERAIGFHGRCLALRENTGDAFGLAASHNNLGLAFRHQGDYEQAVEHYQQSKELFEKIGNRHGLARAYDNLGQVYMDQGQEGPAMEYLKKAVTILTEIGADESEILPEMWQSGAW